MMSSSAVHFEYEEILDNIGSMGRYQVIVFHLVASFSWKYATNLVVTLFNVVRPPFVCRPPDSVWEAGDFAAAAADVNLTSTGDGADQCWVSLENASAPTPCTDFVYDRSQWQETLVTQWNLVCSRNGLEPLVFATYAMGFGFGLVLGILADRIGRRPVILVSCIMEVILSLAESMSPTFVIYLILHFLHGVFATVSLLATVCITEFVACRHRALVANLLWLYWCLGYLSVAVLAYLVRHWRWLQFCVCLPCLCYLACFFVLQESPRWLIAKGRSAEALQVCQHIARMNGRSIPTATAELMMAQRPSSIPEEGSFKEMFNTPVMRRKTLVLFCAWFVISLTYYGISLDSGFVVGDIFANTALSGLVEAPAYLAAWLLAERVGRRKPMLALYIGLGVCLMTTNLLPRDSVGRTVLALLSKLQVTCAFSVIIHYTAEIYPTSVRNMGVFACSAVSRISAVVAPFVVMNGAVSRVGATVTFGCLSVAAGIAVACLPETRGIPLPQTVWEANLITPGQESEFLDLLQKRRDDIAVYFVGRRDSLMMVTTATAETTGAGTSVEAPGTTRATAAAPGTGGSDAAGAAGVEDDPAVFFSSSKYLINPFM